MKEKIEKLYSKAFPSKRSGALYSAFSYPTKIYPEAIAVFIASHTKPGDTVLDTFGGSGTTGLATLLCANPTEEVLDLAEQMNASAVWGPRRAVICELSVLGSFIADTMCNPPNPDKFIEEATKLINRVEESFGWMYQVKDPEGNMGILRHAIWSEVLKCSRCGHHESYWDNAVNLKPLSICSQFKCKNCGHNDSFDHIERVTEEYYDRLIDKVITRKKRVLKRIYGETGTKKWFRDPTKEDYILIKCIETREFDSFVPIVKMDWGDLYRSGYHFGITHAHHFYTKRNLHILSVLWESIEQASPEIRDALKLLVLSYNSSHSTLMTRVVTKSKEKDFVLTGAQSGVLYISNLPVEKNILNGLKRKIKTFHKAFSITFNSKSKVKIIKGSSTDLNMLSDKSVDYVFTDPPFGDYIPYSELNFLNEIWLGERTSKEKEAIISNSQKKGISEYRKLMSGVFKEISRVLKDEGSTTVVFHSAKAEVWKALQDAYQNAGFSVQTSSVLDKLQGSFKQVTSSVTVKGDPLLLLRKKQSDFIQLTFEFEIGEVIEILERQVRENGETPSPERLYSRFITYYLEKGLSVPVDAAEFYEKVRIIRRSNT